MKNFREKYQAMSKTKQNLISLTFSIIVASIVFGFFGTIIHYTSLQTEHICDYTINYRVYVNDSIIDKTAKVRARTSDNHFSVKYPTASSYKGSNSIIIGNIEVESTNQYLELVDWSKENCESNEYSNITEGL